MRTFIIGDIHGKHDKLLSCLQSVNFDYEKDELIQLGDVCDRGLKTYECVEELLKIKNLISIKGNHDACFFDGLTTGIYHLMNQGCKETIESYINALDLPDEIYMKMNGWQTNFDIEGMPKTHYEFFKNQKLYYVDKNNNLFVHGGFNRHFLIDDEIHNTEDVLLWDRDLIAQARSYETMNDKSYPFKTKNNFKEIFVGHTPVQYFTGLNRPEKFANVNLLDTGCGKGGNGVLTIMNLETKEFKQF